MYIQGKRIELVNEEDIKRLIENKIPENKSLDYKRELNIGEGEKRKEFIFDIVSMFNTEGGCLVYGISESKDPSGKNLGIPDKIVGIDIPNKDKLTQQLEDIIRTNTDPSIAHIVPRYINIEGKDVLIIGVSKGIGLPAMTTYNETNKFHKRRNSGKYAVDTYELNQMFTQNQILKKAIDEYRKARIEKIFAFEVFPFLELETILTIHLIPFSFQNEKLLDLTKAHKNHLQVEMKPINCGGWDGIYTFDGFGAFAQSSSFNKISSYDLLIRNGVYEVFSGSISRNSHLGKYIYGEGLINEIQQKINSSLKILERYNVEPPIAMSIGLYWVKDCAMQLDESRLSNKFNLDTIELPTQIINSYEENITKLLEPNFDILWQSVGRLRKQL